jgi:hypothetical protein
MTTPFPPPDFVLAKSDVPGIEVYMPAPPKEEHRPVVAFDCPQCHAETAYSATDGGLTCANCGYYEPPALDVVGKGAEEFEFTLETMTRVAHGWGETRLELQCQNCGVYITVPRDNLTHTCAFCGSNKVIQHEAPQDVLRPRFVIPFQKTPADCREQALEFFGSSWLVPDSLAQVASVERFTGLYLPYWTIDSTSQASWQAEVAHTKTERYYDSSSKSWKSQTTTEWKWESGQARVVFDDLLIRGTDTLSTVLLDRVDNFNLSDLAPYEPQYLAGYQAQAYDVSLEAAWETARRQMRQETKTACKSQASSQQMRNFSMSLDFADESWRYILLPVYLANYQYQDKRYQLIVNGQTGQISGQRPADWGKIWLVMAAILAPGLILGLGAGASFLWYYLQDLLRPDWLIVLGLVAVVLILVTVAINIAIFLQAEALDDV